MRPAKPVAAGAACALLLALAACDGGSGEWVIPPMPAQQSGERVRVSGVIRYHETEGGFYAIRGDDSVTYDPTNLPLEFRKDGLPVEAEGRRRDDVMGIRQVGPMIELERIRTRGAPPSPDEPTAAAPADLPAPSAPVFVNKLWKVSQSSGVEPGTLYAFFEDGTLLITSSHGTPALGRWEYAGDTLTLVEEGLAHPAAVAVLTADSFDITIRSPGEPLRIRFTRATAP